jgi:hypothetical protein
MTHPSCCICEGCVPLQPARPSPGHLIIARLRKRANERPPIDDLLTEIAEFHGRLEEAA